MKRVLQRAERAAEYASVGDVVVREIERDLRIGDALARRDQPLLGEELREVVEAARRIAEHVRLRHFDVVEEQLGRVLRLESDLLQVATALEARHVASTRNRPSPCVLSGTVRAATMMRSAI